MTAMLRIEQLNQFYGESHTLWGEQGTFVQWTNAALRTPGIYAGPGRCYALAPSAKETTSC